MLKYFNEFPVPAIAVCILILSPAGQHSAFNIQYPTSGDRANQGPPMLPAGAQCTIYVVVKSAKSWLFEELMFPK